MIHIGIDPGLKGFICVLDGDGNILDFYKTPILNGDKKEYNIPELVNIFELIKEKYNDEKINIILERATIIPISGSKSVASTFFCNGIFQGVLSSLKLSYQVVSAKAWQKKIFEFMNRKDTKQASILYCSRKYPNYDFRATDRSKNTSNDKTDACCIANYSILQFH